MTAIRLSSIKSVVLPMALALALAGCDGSVTVSTDETHSHQQMDMDAQVMRGLKAHLSFLADDALEGRHPLDQSYTVAAAYVATRFAAMGLRPGGDDGGYYQQVPLRYTTSGGVLNRMQLTGPDGAQALTPLEDFVLAASAADTASEVTGELVFVGHGVYAPEFGIDDYEGLDIDGKIVVMLLGAPPSLPGEERAHFGGQKNAEASKRGAIGVISLWTPAMDKVFDFERVVGLVARPTASWLDSDGEPFTISPNIKVGGAMNPASSAMLFDGAERTYEQVRAESEEGAVKGFALAYSATLAQVSTHKDITSPNIIGIIEGSDPALADEYVTFTAHLDHDGIGAEIDGDSIYNGAADNASGVAVMIEVARSFTKAAPRRSLAFIIVTAEESGLLGADYFARHPTVPKDNIVANINSDGALFFFDFADVLIFGSSHSTLGDVFEQTAADMGLGVSEDPFPEQGFFTRSDHYRFVQQGIPAVFPLLGLGENDAGESGMEVFQGYLGTQYHRPSDDMSLPWNYAAGAKFVRYLATAGANVANADERPVWHDGDFFGKTFAPGDEGSE